MGRGTAYMSHYCLVRGRLNKIVSLAAVFLLAVVVSGAGAQPQPQPAPAITVTVNKSMVFRLAERGTLRPGSIADITIIDPSEKWTFDLAASRSRSRNSPFDKREFTGRAVATIVAGNVIHQIPDRSQTSAA